MNLAVVADEVTAAGWRLAGAHVQVPGTQPVADCFRAALRDADLVLITAEFAALLPAAQLQAALFTQPPLVLVVADLRRRREPSAIEDEVARALGVGL